MLHPLRKRTFLLFCSSIMAWMCLLLSATAAQASSDAAAVVVNACTPPQPDLVINEIMYRDGPSFPSDDWVELYNPTTSTVDLTNWKLQDSGADAFTFSAGTAIPANGYLIAARATATFGAVYPAVTNVVGDFPFGLGSVSDSVKLFSPDGCEVDRVDYLATAPWPTEPNGTGPTLALKWHTLDNSQPGNWETSTVNGGTPGAANGGAPPVNQSPLVTFTVPAGPISATVGSTVNLQAVATDADGSVTQVQFFVDDNLTPLCIATTAPYQCPWRVAFGAHTLRATAFDNEGGSNSATRVITGQFATGVCTPTPATLVINEIMYRAADAADSDDWVELYNPANSAVNLLNWSLSDAGNSFFFANTTLAADGYLVAVRATALFATVYPAVTNYVGDLPFGLSSASDTVRLADPNGCVVDAVAYTSSAPWPEAPNGAGPTLALQWPTLDNSLASNWQASTNNGGTPGAANGGTPPTNQSPVVTITSPTSGISITVGSLVMITATATDSDGTVAAVQFFIDESDVPLCTVNAAPFVCTWQATMGTHTIKAVATDNLGASSSVNAAVTGVVAANACTPTPPALVINEIMYRAADSANTEDWVELYNPTGNVVNLADWALTDSGNSFFLPVTTTVPANGFLVIARDTTLFQTVYPSVTNVIGNFPFGLNNAGEWVALLAPGGCVVDEVTYGVAAPWPATPNGAGPSLALKQSALDNSQPANWSASSQDGGTPGAANGLAPVNQPPAATIITPGNALTLTAGSVLTITAAVTDGDGVIVTVEFLDNGAPIPGCTLTTAPYQCIFTPAAGSHTLTVRATDNQNAVTTSQPLQLTVQPAGSLRQLFLPTVRR